MTHRLYSDGVWVRGRATATTLTTPQTPRNTYPIYPNIFLEDDLNILVFPTLLFCYVSKRGIYEMCAGFFQWMYSYYSIISGAKMTRGRL